MDYHRISALSVRKLIVNDIINIDGLYVFRQYWEKAEFPFECVPHISSLMVAGGTTKVSLLYFTCPA